MRCLYQKNFMVIKDFFGKTIVIEEKKWYTVNCG